MKEKKPRLVSLFLNVRSSLHLQSFWSCLSVTYLKIVGDRLLSDFVWLPLDCVGSSSFNWTSCPLESADRPLLPDAAAVACLGFWWLL